MHKQPLSFQHDIYREAYTDTVELRFESALTMLVQRTEKQKVTFSLGIPLLQNGTLSIGWIERQRGKPKRRRGFQVSFLVPEKFSTFIDWVIFRIIAETYTQTNIPNIDFNPWSRVAKKEASGKIGLYTPYEISASFGKDEDQTAWSSEDILFLIKTLGKHLLQDGGVVREVPGISSSRYALPQSTQIRIPNLCSYFNGHQTFSVDQDIYHTLLAPINEDSGESLLEANAHIARISEQTDEIMRWVPAQYVSSVSYPDKESGDPVLDSYREYFSLAFPRDFGNALLPKNNRTGIVLKTGNTDISEMNLWITRSISGINCTLDFLIPVASREVFLENFLRVQSAYWVLGRPVYFDVICNPLEASETQEKTLTSILLNFTLDREEIMRIPQLILDMAILLHTIGFAFNASPQVMLDQSNSRGEISKKIAAILIAAGKNRLV